MAAIEPPTPTSARASSGSLQVVPGPPDYNTVFERIMRRTEDDEPLSLAVVGVAYAMYKQEKRAWIIEHTARMGCRPTPEQVEFYVSTWNDLRIDSTIVKAESELKGFFNEVFVDIKDQLSDDIYRGQFKSLQDALSRADQTAGARHEGMQNLVRAQTRSSWGVSIGQNLVASAIWTLFVIVVLVSITIDFDYKNIGPRMRAFMNPPADAATPPPRN